MFIFKKSYYKKINDLEREVKESKAREAKLQHILDSDLEIQKNEIKKLKTELTQKNSKLDREISISKGEKLKVENLRRDIKEKEVRLQQIPDLDRLISINKGEKLKVENLEREVKESKVREAKLQNMLDLDLETQKKKEVELKQNIVDQIQLNKSMKLSFEEQLEKQAFEIEKLKTELKLKKSELDRETSISKGEKFKVENLEREVKESRVREAKLKNMLDLGLEDQKKEKAELEQKIEALVKDKLILEEKLNNEVSINKKNEKLLVDASKDEKKLENEIEKQKEEFHKSLTDAVKENNELKQRIESEILLNQKTKSSLKEQLEKQQLEITELKEIEVELRRTMDLSLENLSKQKDEKLKKLEEQLNEKILVNKRRKQFLIDTSKDTEILKKQLANLMSDNKKLKKEKTDLKQNIVDQLQLNKSIKLSIEEELDKRTAEVEKLKVKLKDKDKKIKLLPIQSARSEALLKHEVEDLKQKRDNLFELVKTLRNNKGKVTPLQKMQASENKKLKIEIELNKTINLDLEDQLANQIAKNIKLQNNLKLKDESNNFYAELKEENKDLQDKLHQKERAAFKLSIISKEATNNLSLLKGQVELLSNDNIKYKTEINNLKEQLKEAEKSKQLKISAFDPINKSKDSLEKQIQAKENLKPISTSQFNGNSNTPADIKSLNKKQWNEILEFGTRYKIFNNRDKQKLNNIIVRLKIKEPLRPAQIEEGKELFNLVVKNGFTSSIAVPLSTPKKIEEESCLTPFGKEFNRKNSNISEEKTPEVLKKTNQLDEDELLEKVKAFKYDEWNQMFEWAKKKKKLKSKDLSLLNGLAIRSTNQELSENELILGLELYFILMSEGFELVKEVDVDDFLMQFVEESPASKESPKENLENNNKIIESSKIEIWDFNKLLKEGLTNGQVKSEWVQSINFDEELEVEDYYEVIEELEDRGIRVIE